MIIADSSIWIEFLKGSSGRDLDFFSEYLESQKIYMSPVVLSELLSSTQMNDLLEKTLTNIPLAPLSGHFWSEAGLLRRKLYRKGFSPALADTLIAQNCIELDLPLLTRDQDFKPFAKWGGLKLVG